MDKRKIKIEFNYYSGNENIFNLIKKIADTLDINGVLYREDDRVFIYLYDNLEKIEKFLEKLGKYLPLSIFMEEAKISEVENIPIEINSGFKLLKAPNVLPLNLSTCPKCLEKLLNPKDRRFYFPFISCEYCGSHYSYLYKYPFVRENTIFKYFKKCENCEKEGDYPLISCFECLTPVYLKKGENERYAFDSEKSVGAFKTLAGVINKNNLVNVYTTKGKILVGKLNKENLEKIKDIIDGKPISLLITNPKILNKVAILSSEEIKTLYSQEKPILIAQLKDFEDKELVSYGKGFINIKLPDEPILTLLALELNQLNIDYIFFIPYEDEISLTEFIFDIDLPVVNKQQDTYMFVAQGRRFIKEGEKGILPTIIKSKKTGNLSIGGDYIALDLGNGEYLIDKKEIILQQLKDFVDEVNNINILNGEYEFIDIPYKDIKSYKSYEGAILSVLGEYNKVDSGAVGVYFSYYSNEDTIIVKDKKGKIRPVIDIKPILTYGDIRKDTYIVLENLKNSSEEGEKLVKNLFSKYPEINDKILPVEKNEKGKEIKSLTHVLNIISYLIGVFNKEKVNYFEEPYLYLQGEALDFVGNQGVMVDFKLGEKDGDFYLDWLKTIQSVLAYKLAEVNNDMIAFSIFESLGDWILEETIKILDKLKLENIVLAGNFFANPVLIGRVLKHYGRKDKILLNRKLPIDKQNLVFGGVFI